MAEECEYLYVCNNVKSEDRNVDVKSESESHCMLRNDQRTSHQA